MDNTFKLPVTILTYKNIGSDKIHQVCAYNEDEDGHLWRCLEDANITFISVFSIVFGETDEDIDKPIEQYYINKNHIEIIYETLDSTVLIEYGSGI
jgi:hypothetical protein